MPFRVLIAPLPADTNLSDVRESAASSLVARVGRRPGRCRGGYDNGGAISRSHEERRFGMQ